MPLHTPSALAPQVPRLARFAALAAATCATAGGVTIAAADDQPDRRVQAIPKPSQAVGTRYFDIEANKATSMRALGRHMAEQRANPTVR